MPGAERVWVGPPNLPAADCFQNRPERAALAVALETGGAAVIGGILRGMGGVGKTQLAIDFANTAWQRDEVDVCVWVDATSRESIVSILAEAAGRVGNGDNNNAEHAAKRFINWLRETPQAWLVVFDDLSEPDDLNDFRPPHHRFGRTVITTRRRDAALRAAGYAWVDVDLYTEAQALNYLRDRLDHEPRALAGAEDLVKALERLPLALAQASAVILDDRTTCRRYLVEFNDRGKTLKDLAPRKDVIDGYQRVLRSTWNISIEQAERADRSRLPRSIMEILSLLDPNGVPDTLLMCPAVRAYSHAESADQFATSVATLHRMSLIEFAGSEKEIVRVHDVVQRSVRETTNADLGQAALALADGLMSVWPSGNRDSEEARLVRGNAAFLLGREVAPGLYTPTLHPLLFKLGESYGRIGQASTAFGHFEKLLDSARALLGPDDPETLRVRHHYAFWLGFAGRVREAGREFQQLADDQTRVLGPDHADTLTSRHNVARFCGRSGDAAGAVERLDALILDQTRVLGPEHVDTLTSRNIRGYWRGRAGDAEAERGVRELEELLEIRLGLGGPDNDGILTTRNDLALCRGEAGDLAGAVADLESLVPDRRRELGPDDPATMSSRSYLGYWRCKLGQTTLAIEELDSVLADHVRVLGESHPSSLRTANYLAAAYAESGDYGRAVGVLERILPVQLEVLGPDHPNTRLTQRNLDAWRKRGGGAA